jgi:transcriptional regulator with XRE-family HTH domain
MASSGMRRGASGTAVAATQAAAAPPRVGEQIQRLRSERKMTLDDLSRAAGVSKSMLSEIERDKANPTIAVAWRLTNALGVSLDSLFAPQKAP